MPKLFCPTMSICENREIPLAGQMSLETIDGEFIQIPEPSAHTGPRPVRMKVLSLSHRVGLVSFCENIYSNHELFLKKNIIFRVLQR